MKTRAEWYAENHGGGWRKARKARRCDCRPGPYHIPCMNVTQPGERYFDTNAYNPYHPSLRATIGLCEACAMQDIYDPMLTLPGIVQEMERRVSAEPGKYNLTAYEERALVILARMTSYSPKQITLIHQLDAKILKRGKN